MKKYLKPDNILTAIDIGTTKICVLIAQPIDNDTLDIIGIGKAPSCGISKGMIVDVSQSVRSIKSAIKEAELMAGCTVENVIVGISGAHVQSFVSQGMVPIRGGKIKESDISSVLTAAKAVTLKEGQQILHAIAQGYTVDGHPVMSEPVGVYGVRLEAKAHIITGSIASVQNLVRCCQLAEVTVEDVILEPLASAQAVLSPDEKNLGVGILDIGGGTTDFAIYNNGLIRHTKIFPVAGNHVTRDIALCLRTTLKDAQRVKHEYGHSLVSENILEEEIKIEMVQGDDQMSTTVRELSSIIEPRMEELLKMVNKEILANSLLDYMSAGLVITGGGSLLNLIESHAQMITSISTRVGKPRVPEIFKESLQNPSYSTSYGLLLFKLRNSKYDLNNRTDVPLFSKVLWRMKSWVTDFF